MLFNMNTIHYLQSVIITTNQPICIYWNQPLILHVLFYFTQLLFYYTVMAYYHYTDTFYISHVLWMYGMLNKLN
jgi:hypothetical protein